LTADGHGLDPELAGGPDDPGRDLAAVRDEEPTHGIRQSVSIVAMTSPGPRSPSFSAVNDTRVPEAPALTSENCFMTSTSPIVWSAVTASPSSTKAGWSGAGRR